MYPDATIRLICVTLQWSGTSTSTHQCSSHPDSSFVHPHAVLPLNSLNNQRLGKCQKPLHRSRLCDDEPVPSLQQAELIRRHNPMHLPPRDRSLGDGVYFSKTDYIGPSRRIVIVCIDTIVLLMMGWGLSSAWVRVLGQEDGLISALVVMTWLYLVPLKRSAWRTVGYQMTGAKLVNLQGARPALWLLTLRSLLWMFFFIPFNFLMDVLWCSVDDDRQSIRDRITNTCLVKNRAIPIGNGEVHIAYYFVLGYMFTYSHVVHPDPTRPVSAGK